MNLQIHFLLLLFLCPLSLSSTTQNQSISSNSILVALLDSRYTEFAELIEKAILLTKIEKSLLKNNITFFAPENAVLAQQLKPEFRRFLLEPRNIHSLQYLILSHIVPKTLTHNNNKEKNDKNSFFTGTQMGIGNEQSRAATSIHDSASNEESSLLRTENKMARVDELSRAGTRRRVAPRLHELLSNETIDLADFGEIVKPNDVVREDGVIHGIGKLRIPKKVMDEFNSRRSLGAISAVKPEGAPEMDPRTHRLKKPSPVPAGSVPVLPIYDAMAPGPSLAPAPAPGPGGGHHHFDGESQVKDFIQTLVHYGGYNELADILVNLTSLATEMGKLVSEGYVLTVLAPNDEAMAKLTTDRLSEPGAPEQIVYYHIIPEYQTEESMYNSVRRFGKVRYDTLRLPHKVTAEEADGSVKFGFGEGSAYLFDPDIYTDGRISVQGIDGVLFPFEETKTTPLVKQGKATKVVKKARRGKLLEVACGFLGSFGHDSHFTSCQ